MRNRLSVADGLGRRGLEEHGAKRWMICVRAAVRVLRGALVADYVVLGGGNAKLVKPLPAGARRGGNEDAFNGGFRLWDEIVEPHDRDPHRVWRVVR